ncbi:hypothetical protein DI487_08190 [Flavobacterium sediminis]|uniref:TMF family protein n=1 Tax=Flavobacterium sediminis TaxID=2201181 RepID=A0A2U8QUN5_9FLAO|nr:hypothetical protein [Flavobacterium sediminis]AWM13843.1 hypothetical protein DI487_08190 [Flavobacterium sediminis]
MKTTHHLTIVFMLSLVVVTNAQNVQSDALATSGGLNAGTTTSIGGNTFYGYNSGNNNQVYGNGFNNTFVGHSSTVTTGGHSNTCIGNNTSGLAGNYNIFLGASSGTQNSGDSNIFIGSSSGGYFEGNENIFIGRNTGFEGSGSKNIYIGNYLGEESTEQNTLRIDNFNQTTSLIWGDFAEEQLKFNGKVGIGYGFGNYPTTTGTADVSSYNLFVNGGILTEEVRVTLQSTWADYVFKEGYKLPSLEEVEKHIQEKGHLINVPSAEEIETNGIELGEMTKIQQEKIEELTLYLIKQKKVNEEQEKEIKELKNLVQSLLQKVQDSNE